MLVEYVTPFCLQTSTNLFLWLELHHANLSLVIREIEALTKACLKHSDVNLGVWNATQRCNFSEKTLLQLFIILGTLSLLPNTTFEKSFTVCVTDTAQAKDE